MTSEAFWEPQPTKHGDTLKYELGPLTAHVSRLEREWHFDYFYADHPLQTEIRVSREPTTELPPDIKPDREVRVADSTEEPELNVRLELLPADRPFIARPRSRLHLIENSTVHLYVTTPVWVRFVRMPGNIELQTVPSWRPTDSWFGPPTGNGPLCYGSKTSAYQVLEDLPVHALRAVTHTIIENRGSSVDLDRILVPIPHLSIWAAESGRLWTESVSVRRDSDGQISEARMLQRPPENAGPCKRLNHGRFSEQSRQSLRGLMNSLFG